MQRWRKTRNVCGFLKTFLKTGVFAILKKITIIFIEVGYTRFPPDAGFGLIRRCESKSNTESIHDVAEMIKRSTSSSGRNQVVLFNPKNSSAGNNTNAFIHLFKLEKSTWYSLSRSMGRYILAQELDTVVRGPITANRLWQRKSGLCRWKMIQLIFQPQLWNHHEFYIFETKLFLISILTHNVGGMK